MNFRPPSSPLRLALLLLFALALAAVAPARAATFTAGLSPARLDQIGIVRLSSSERAALDRLVSRELAAARAGGVTAFAGTFVSRRTPAERSESGIDRLSDGGRTALNEAVAAALAAPTAPAPSVPALRGSSSEIVARRTKPIVHGEVTLTVGTGRDGSFQAASVYTEVSDPERHVTVGIGVSTFRGKGGWCRGPYPAGYYDGW